MRTNWTWLLPLAFLLCLCTKDDHSQALAHDQHAKIKSEFDEMPARYLATLLYLIDERGYLSEQVHDVGAKLRVCQYDLNCMAANISQTANEDFRLSLRRLELPSISIHEDESNWVSTYDRSAHRFQLAHKKWHYSLDFDMDNEMDDARGIGIIPEVNALIYEISSQSGQVNNIYEPSATNGKIDKINIHTDGEQVRFEFILGPYPNLRQEWKKSNQISTTVEFYLDVNQHLGLECTGMYKLMFHKMGTKIEISSDVKETVFYEIESSDDFSVSLDDVRGIAIEDAFLGHFEMSTAVNQLQISTQKENGYLEFDFAGTYHEFEQPIHSFFNIMSEVTAR